MRSSTEECGSDFARVIVILKELGKETLLEVFQDNELTDDTLDCLKTQQDMRSELQDAKMSKGVAIKFSTTWFSHKKSDIEICENIPSTSKQSISEGATISDPKERKQSEKASATNINISSEKSAHLQSKEIESSDHLVQNLTGAQIENQALHKKVEQNGRKKGKLPNTSGEKTTENTQAIQTTTTSRPHVRRPFGKRTEDFHYIKDYVLQDTEDKTIEYKALTQESPKKLPWKIMNKARPFICGILNAGGQGTIYFGIGDSYDPSTNYKRGAIIGLEVEDLKDEIIKAFQSTLDDHIRSDGGKMTKGGDMDCVKIYFVPVSESDKQTSRYVIEIEVQRLWPFCEDRIYYFQKWTEKRGSDIKKSGLQDLYKIEKEKWEDPVIRTCGSSSSVKGIDTAKQIKEPLSQKYKDNTKIEVLKPVKGIHNQDAESSDIKKLSTNVRKSLRELDFKENSYILIANKVLREYRGSNTIAFLQKIPWIAVFDLFDLFTEKDGLYHILNETSDCARPVMKDLEDFKDLKSNDAISTAGTTWIMRSKEMYDSSWTRCSKDCLYRALSAYYEQCRTGHLHCVFLLLNNENLQEMADIVDSSFSIIGNDANKHISIISEKKEFGTQLIKFLKADIIKDVKPPCTVFGILFDLLRNNVKALLGSIDFDEPEATTELPYLDGKLRPVLNKRIKSLTDLEVYIPNPILSTEFEDIKKAKENFYLGNVITQINLFHRDAIERTLEKELKTRIDGWLNYLSSPEEFEQYVETVTLKYESGSGATTLGRQILWSEKDEYRCAVVKTISEQTDYQISKFQKFLYETSETSPFLIPPVLILVDNIPEQQVHQLSDRLSRNKTKCVLLSTIPLDKLTKGNADDFTLGKLDLTEINKVRGVISTLESERKKEAAIVLDREKRFMWLGLELFGQNYAVIKPRLSNHIHQVLSQSLSDELKDGYEMILHFCCLLHYYSKRRFIYPQPCVEFILYLRGGLQAHEERKIDKIHDKFGGLLLEEFDETVGYHGWRPAHALVGEVVREEIDLFKTAKKLIDEMDKGKTYVKKFLIDNTVNVFLQREKIVENPSDNESDGLEDELLGILETRTKYSQLILDIIQSNQGEQSVRNALDLLISLNENVTTVQHKAHTCQQIARMFAYEVGINKISEDVLPLVARANKIVNQDNFVPENQLDIAENVPIASLGVAQQENEFDIPSEENGFDIAHRVIDEATKLQKSYVHHLVTKATFYRIKLKHLHDNTSRSTAENELKIDFEEAINTTKKGIDLYDEALKNKNRDSYLHAMIGKIHTLVVLVEMFKKLPFFSQHYDGQDESFTNYVTFRKHPEVLKILLTEENLDYFISLISTAVQLLNEFLGEIQIRRKLSHKAHEIKELDNAKIRAMKLRTKFYEVTNLDRTNIEKDFVLKEDIVYDLLYKNNESPFSSWKRLLPTIIGKIYVLLENAIPLETSSHNAMVMLARAAVQHNVNIEKLSEIVQLWCKKYPNSQWAHMFNYMIHFPVPNGSLKADVAAVKSSVDKCRISQRSLPGYRKSGAEYLLGKGFGTNSITPPHNVVTEPAEPKTVFSRSRDVQLETEFWRSRIVYEKLERLKGKKNFQKKGVLTYKGIEIPFDNERYPKESRDELWFCLGFTITGPYAYDPIDKDTYKKIREKFDDGKSRNLPKKDESKSAWSTAPAKPKAVPINQMVSSNAKAMYQGKNAGHERFPTTINLTNQDIKSKDKNQETRDESLMTGASSSPRDFQACADSEEPWKNDPKFKKTARSSEGHQNTFPPIKLDKLNRLCHGAQVKGAAKSVECNRHTSRIQNFPTNCTFAHANKRDPVRQTVCELCTKKELPFCEEKQQHKRHHYDLGPYIYIPKSY